MNPLEISARFAAYSWYLGVKNDDKNTESEAVQFARKNSAAFTSYAHEGLGRLLIRLAAGKREVRRRRLAVEACS